MSVIFLTVSKRAIEEMKRRVREAADRGPLEGVVDGPHRLSVLKNYFDQLNAERKNRRRRRKESSTKIRISSPQSDIDLS